MTSTAAMTSEPGTVPVRPGVRAVAQEARRRLSAGAVGAELSGLTNTERVDLLRELEDLTASVAAVQARLAADLDAAVRAERAEAGVPAERRGAGVAAQVALARRVSPVRGRRYLGLGKALVTEMPHTMAALAEGTLSEWRATLLVRESACLTAQDRASFDAQLCADPTRFVGWGDKRFIAEARYLTARLDQEALVRRAAQAEQDRRVTIRPAPDTMAQVTQLLPVAQGVAVYAALGRRAAELRAQGDARTRGQIMADTLVERVTGLPCADAVPVHVQLVMTDQALLDAAEDPAYVDDYGVVPARWARNLVTRAEQQDADSLGVWVRRLFTRPGTGELVAMQSRARRAPAGLAAFVRVRDRTCRTPWCDAPIRHIDHVVDHADGGPTDAEYLQGLCEACNYAKLAPGWSARPADRSIERPGHLVATRSPTGHTYSSRAPELPGWQKSGASHGGVGRWGRAGPALRSRPRERLEDAVRGLTLADERAGVHAMEIAEAMRDERAPTWRDDQPRLGTQARYGECVA